MCGALFLAETAPSLSKDGKAVSIGFQEKLFQTAALLQDAVQRFSYVDSNAV